jgi:hypothetical protein
MRINNQPDTRLLEQRSRLEFHYPTEKMIIFLPFYENPTITESKSANLVEYNPLGRSGSLFAYTGAKSKKIKIELHYTLPHLMNFNMGVEKFRRLINADSKEAQKGLFTDWDKGTAGEIQSNLAYEMEKSYWRMRLENEGMADILATASDQEFMRDQRVEAIKRGGFMSSLTGNEHHPGIDNILNGLELQQKHKVIDTMVFFVNILRTSVDNNATNPLFGPPIIRLVYGTMYQSVPCICKNYSLAFLDEEMGLDLETLTPRRLKISLDLVELRVGNFGAYEKAKFVNRDNIAGWESVINKPLTTDPGGL